MRCRLEGRHWFEQYHSHRASVTLLIRALPLALRVRSHWALTMLLALAGIAKNGYSTHFLAKFSTLFCIAKANGFGKSSVWTELKARFYFASMLDLERQDQCLHYSWSVGGCNAFLEWLVWFIKKSKQFNHSDFANNTTALMPTFSLHRPLKIK